MSKPILIADMPIFAGLPVMTDTSALLSALSPICANDRMPPARSSRTFLICQPSVDSRSALSSACGKER